MVKYLLFVQSLQMKEYTYFVKYDFHGKKMYAAFTCFNVPVEMKVVIGKIVFDLEKQGIQNVKICTVSRLEQDLPDTVTIPIMKAD